MRRQTADGDVFVSGRYGTIWWRETVRRQTADGDVFVRGRYGTIWYGRAVADEPESGVLRSADGRGRGASIRRAVALRGSAEGANKQSDGARDVDVRVSHREVSGAGVDDAEANLERGRTAKKESAKKGAKEGAETPQRSRGPRSLAEIVSAILADAGEPVRYRDVVAAAREQWESDGRTPPASFSGMTWHALNRTGVLVERGVWAPKPEQPEEPGKGEEAPKKKKRGKKKEAK